MLLKESNKFYWLLVKVDFMVSFVINNTDISTLVMDNEVTRYNIFVPKIVNILAWINLSCLGAN